MIHNELQRANENFPLFASTHEGLAVIQEEIWEAENEMERLKRAEEYFKIHTYGNGTHKIFAPELIDGDINNQNMVRMNFDDLREAARNLSAEAAQVAAMCDKWKLSFGGDDLLTR